jgi:hypothetical protein
MIGVARIGDLSRLALFSMPAWTADTVVESDNFERSSAARRRSGPSQAEGPCAPSGMDRCTESLSADWRSSPSVSSPLCSAWWNLSSGTEQVKPWLLR